MSLSQRHPGANPDVSSVTVGTIFISMLDTFDVIVVGGGHAGSEAACAAARLGAQTLLVTANLETIGQMSCNPAIGGIAKGTVVREVDALGGVMGRAADRATIQFRMLNRSKGPAVWAPRAQCDRGLYRRAVRNLLEDRDSLRVVQGTVTALLLGDDGVYGVLLGDGRRYGAKAVVLTAGTFLRGRIHIGTETRISAGRAGDPRTNRRPSRVDLLLFTRLIRHTRDIERRTGIRSRLSVRLTACRRTTARDAY